MTESSGLRTLQTGTGAATEGTGRAAAAGGRNAAGDLAGTLRDVRQAGCKCARGERHGPLWYLSVTLGSGRTAGGVIAAEQVERVRRWIENYHQIKEHLEKISAINRELLRRERLPKRR